MRKVYVMGDIHGNHKALMQCLKRSKFDYDNDELIVLGDTCDGFVPEIKQCIDELLKIKNLIYILGNHDMWAYDWFLSIDKGRQHKSPDPLWETQGGRYTLISYDESDEMDNPAMCRDYNKIRMPKEHLKLFEDGNLWYEDEKNRLFVHGGIDARTKADRQPVDMFLWDRTLILEAAERHAEGVEKYVKKYKEVFVGHSQTNSKYMFRQFAGTEPLHFCNIWNLDTGAGWSGKLTIMDVDTKEYWQSDLASELYPELDKSSR